MPTLSEIATRHPAGSRVLHRHGLDFCCGGRRSFDDACAERGLAAHEILAEIEREDAGQPGAGWEERPLDDIVAHLVGFYHHRLRDELPLLVTMAARVESRHGDKAQCPRGLADHLAGMHEAVLEHLAKEERILFPLILSGRGAQAGAPIHVMEVEHEDHRASLLEIRRLTAGLVPPAPACTTWRALYLRLSEFERELMEHIHLENNVLFTRALLA
jgi:regulator of cell morphogenesis and NO signaling